MYPLQDCSVNKISSNGVVAIAAFFFYNYCFLLSFSFVHIKVFFLEKSLKVSLFVAKTDVCDWYIMVYKNETFLFILQRSIIEVS